MVKYTEGTFVNTRKQTLHTVQYLPDSGSPDAVVYWHHGITEHIARYHAHGARHQSVVESAMATASVTASS
eukprot:363141-Chlamydomonas_euryale.AAC.8